MTPIGAQMFAARNLELLTAIENTLDALAADIDLVNAIHRAYEEIRERLGVIDGAIDPDLTLQAKLEKASDACARIYRDTCRRHASACSDPDLRQDDGVAEAYSEYIDALSDLHGTVEKLREWIATHDAVIEPTTGVVYATADDLFAALLPEQ